MAGRVVLTSPWCKQGLPIAQRPEVEAEVPDGAWLHVSCGPSGPGKPWVLRGMRGDWPDVERLWETKVWNLALKDAALFALRHHAEKVSV
jgi:hypothetical protein